MTVDTLRMSPSRVSENVARSNEIMAFQIVRDDTNIKDTNFDVSREMLALDGN